MIKTENQIRICPFCGHHGHKLLHNTVNVQDEDGKTEVRDIYQMECICCGARGPTEYTSEFAVDSWNIIHSKPAHEDDDLFEKFEIVREIK